MSSPNITKLGLLSEISTDVASVQEQPKYMSFPHKILHEFAASLFIANTLNDTRIFQVSIN